MRALLVLAVAVVLSACSSEGGKSTGTSSQRAKPCTDRMLAEVKGDHGPLVGSYIQRTYCDRFAKHGWVYAG